ncbi:MAG TPA: hypothetical protein VFU72_12705, partial [Nitrolancea sp.]|nr:hypothetical protein [Nitrolancea sp.]
MDSLCGACPQPHTPYDCGQFLPRCLAGDLAAWLRVWAWPFTCPQHRGFDGRRLGRQARPLVGNVQAAIELLVHGDLGAGVAEPVGTRLQLQPVRP